MSLRKDKNCGVRLFRPPLVSVW